MLALITTGPASTPIDEVRRITNFSTGEIGALLAGALAAQGFEPLLFRGRGATHRDVPCGALLHEFTSNDDLAHGLSALSSTRGSDVLVVFHAAALADYQVTAIRGPDGPLEGTRKIPGDLAHVHLVLEPAAKILPQLRGWFPHAWIVGWKYELEGTRDEAAEAARTQSAGGFADSTVLNGTAYGPGFGLFEDGKTSLHFDTKNSLARHLANRAAQKAASRQ